MPGQSLNFQIFAEDRASDTFKRLGEQASGAGRNVTDLSGKLDKLGTRVTTARVGLEGDKEAQHQLDSLDVKLLRLGKRAANPSISVEGVARARAEISGIDLALDRLSEKTATPKVGRLTSLFNRLPGVNLGGGAGGAAGAGGGAASAGGSGLPLVGGLGATGGIAAVTAAIAALPFVAQAAAGGITLALGGALTGLGILSASKSKQVRADWTGLFGQAGAELRQVTKPFVGALEGISKVAQSVLPSIMESLVGPMKILAPAFKTFSDALLRAFAQPAVANSLQAVAKAFGSILKALAPQLATDIGDVATGITRIANAISKNPGAFAAMISFFFKAAGFAFSMVAALTSVANYIEKHFIPALGDIRKAWDDSRHQTAVILDGMRHDTAHTWDQIFSNSIGTVIRLVHNLETWFNSGRHEVAVIFDGQRHDIASAWDGIWHTSLNQVETGVTKVVAWFNGMPGRILKALFGLGHSLYAFAHAALDDFWSGLKAVGGSILSWVGNFVGDIVGDVKKLLGISSPSSVFYDIGKNMMLGLSHGIKAHARSAASAATGAVGGLGGPASAGAAQAQAYARSRLADYGWSASQMPSLIALWNQESGWNRLAQNPTSGAYGIPQALPPSKMGPAANPPLSSAAAQINWGLGYIRSVYGSPAAAEAHENAVHWYGSGLQGGIFSKPTLIGVGERGPEMVSVTPGRRGGGVVNYNLTVTAPVGSNPRDIGRQIVDYVRQFEAGSGKGWRS